MNQDRKQAFIESVSRAKAGLNMDDLEYEALFLLFEDATILAAEALGIDYSTIPAEWKD